jgi:hypothetical protein
MTLNFAIWKDDWERVEALILAHKFTLREIEFPEETGRLVHKGTNFEFYLLQKNAARDIFVGGRWADWPFPDDCWNATGCLQGLLVPVMSPKNLIDGKQRCPDQEHGSPLRKKDQQEIDILRSYLAQERCYVLCKPRHFALLRLDVNECLPVERYQVDTKSTKSP